MKVPPNYKFREGDIVSVKAVVRFDVDLGDGQVHVTVNGYAHAAVETQDVFTIERRRWDVGAAVRNINDYDDRGHIVAFQDGMAWVKLRSGAFGTYDSLDLEDDPNPEERP